MPKKRSPILDKVSSFIKISISQAKLTKPITLNLIFFKKSRGAKKFKLLRHYNYGFIQEYQFSPSNTPLILRRIEDSKKRKRSDLYSMLVMCTCLGGFASKEARDYEDNYYNSSIEYFPAIENAATVSSNIDEKELENNAELSYGEDGCSSVDERAERFIEKFYEQMRMQRRESNLLLTAE